MAEAFNYRVGDIADSYEIEVYAMGLHYDKWDTEGMEESDLPERINETSFYILARIPVSQISEPDFYIDEDKVDEYAEMSAKTMPPIVLEKNNTHSYHVIDGSHRFLALIKMNEKEILAYVPVSKK